MTCPVCGSQSENQLSCSRCGYVLPKTSPSNAPKKNRRYKLQLLLHLLWLAFPLYYYVRLVRSGAYLNSLEIARDSKNLQEVLGQRVHFAGFPVGSALPSYNSDFAEWSVSIAGSAGRGRLYGVANRVGSDWEYSRLVVVAAGNKVDLTPTPARISLPSAGDKVVYLVPLDLNPQQSLSWAGSYYKAKFGIDVRVLSPIATTPAEYDLTRHQLIADKCVDLILRSHKELAIDPFAVVIGVTSRDMFISDYSWKYAENLREGGRFGIVSSARLGPTDYPGKWNKELLNSRLQKMLSKNLAMLFFGLPLSNDYTSLLSGGVLSGRQIDYMTGKIVGAEGHWDPFFSYGEPLVSMAAIPGKPVLWQFGEIQLQPSDLRADHVSVDLAIGLFSLEKTDFYFNDEFPLEIRRAYRNADDQLRPFGIGTNDSLDIFLVGRMGSFIDLIGEDGGQVRFLHANPRTGEHGDVYRTSPSSDSAPEALFDGKVWHVTLGNGWTYLFPYRPQASGSYVTILTGYVDPKGRMYEMVRNDSGDLLTVTAPDGKRLQFDHNPNHTIRRISNSRGRSVQYDYDTGGRLIRVSDSEGRSEIYTYNDRNEMLSVAKDGEAPLLTNQYTSTNLISRQTLSDGRHFEYSYTFGTRMVITQNLFVDPNGLQTYFDYGSNGYVQSLPSPPPQ